MPSKSRAKGEPTPHRSRRRRKEPAAVDKENTEQRDRSLDLIEDIDFSEGKSLKGDSENARISSSQHAKLALERFRAAAASQAGSAAAFWKKHASLTECIVQTSVQFPKSDSAKSLLLLEQNSNDVFQTCRTAVKDATEGNSIADNLYVAIHGIRGISSILVAEPKQIEAAVKVLYYAIKKATDECLAAKDRTKCLQSAIMCLGALQVMGKLLSRYSIQLPDDQGYISFSCKSSDTELSFPLPAVQQKAKRAVGTIAMKQVFKIGIQSVSDAANCLSRLTSVGFEHVPESASDFGREIHDIISRTIDDGEPLFKTCLLFVRTVVHPWIVSLASSAAASKDDVDDALGYAKRIHGVLSEAAVQLERRVKKSSSEKNRSAWNARCLALREQAVISLVLAAEDDKKPSTILLKGLQKRTFETACSYAWKASALYLQHRNSEEADETLTNFHARIGRALDLIATSLDECVGYVEYCVYRAFHLRRKEMESCLCPSKKCVFSSLPFQFAHRRCLSRTENNERKSEHGAEFIAFAFVLIVISCEFEQIMGRTTGGIVRTDALSACLEICEPAIHCFRQAFLDQPRSAMSMEILSKYQRLLEVVSIDRLAFDFLSCKDFALTESNLQFLEVSANILIECTGPFAAVVFNDSAEPKAQHCARAVESFIRGAQLFDYLYLRPSDNSNQGEVSNRTMSKADVSLQRLFEFLRRGDAAMQEMERAAKAVAVIGRRRFDHNKYEQSLLPTFLSIKLFKQLSENGPPGSATSYQLPMRFSHLASVFQSLDMKEEACISFVLSAAQDCRDLVATDEEEEEDSEVSLELLKRICFLSNGVISMAREYKPDKKSFSGAKKLARVYWSFRRESKARLTSERDRIDLLRTLERSLVLSQRVKADQHELSDLLRAAFLLDENPEWEEGCVNRFRSDQIYTTCTILSSICEIARGQISADEFVPNEDQAAFPIEDELDGLIGLVSSLCRRVLESHQAGWKDLTMAIVHVAAAGSFSLHENGNLDRLENKQMYQLALRLNTKAHRHLERIKDDRVAFLASAVRISATVQNYTLDPETKYPEVPSILSMCRSTIDGMSAEKSARGSSMFEAVAACLLRSLTIMRNHLSSRGDVLYAAQAALLMLQVTRSLGHNETWHRALAGSDLCESGLPDAASEVMALGVDARKIIEHCAQPEEMEDLITLELRAAQLLFHMQVCSSGDIQQHLLEIKLVDRFCSETKTTNTQDESQWILLNWIETTCALALAEAFERLASPFAALDHIRRSLNICRSMTKGVQLGSETSESSQQRTIKHPELISTLKEHFQARQIDCLRRRASIYSRLGKHRDAAAYALQTMQQCITLDGPKWISSRWKLEDIAPVFKKIDFSNPRQAAAFRLMICLKAAASSLQTVNKALATDNPIMHDLIEDCRESKLDILTREMESLWNLIAVGDCLYQPFVGGIPTQGDSYRKLVQSSEDVLSSQNALDFLASVASGINHEVNTAEAFVNMQSQVVLRKIRHLLTDCSPENLEQTSLLCTSLVESQRAPAQCRAWALFYLGLAELSSARHSGALEQLWTGHSNIAESTAECASTDPGNSPDPLAMARFYFRGALELAGPATDMLTRDILRCLALATGPFHERQPVGCSTAALIHTSIGCTARQAVSCAFFQSENSNADPVEADLTGVPVEDSEWSFGALDTSFNTINKRNDYVGRLFQKAAQIVPPDCRIVSATLCPTGDILVNSLNLSTDSELSSPLESNTVCIFAQREDEDGSLLQPGLHKQILDPLDELIQQNEAHLSGLDMDAISDRFNDSSSKRSWWDERQRIDEALQRHVQSVEQDYFGTPSVKQVLTGDKSAMDDEDSWMGMNLASKFEAACRVDEPDNSSESPGFGYADAEQLTVAELKNELVSHGVDRKSLSRLKKGELIDLLVKKSQKSKTSPTQDPVRDGQSQSILLVLDEHLHRFPWEGMQIFEGKAVCRVPSLPFVLAPLLDNQGSPGLIVDPRGARYVVDPEGNLGNTKDRLVPCVEQISSRRGWDWRGIVGSMPSSEFIEEALTKDRGLLLYCGHGGGQKCFSRSKVESLLHSTTTVEQENKMTQPPRRCRSSLILMGCSSGKLESVNRKDSTLIGRTPIYYEPEGTALSYLCAGSPCVVGNLWDVTDRDIDRYCVTLLEDFLDGDDGKSLAQCVADARSSCKMRNIVGLAPVCYGLPVHLQLPR